MNQSVVTCQNCGSGWNVAGLQGLASIGCQRCGAQIPLQPQQPAWNAQPQLSGEAIMAMPAAPGVPFGENALPCSQCGTVLDAAGLPTGVAIRCGRCGAIFARPSAAQVAAALGQPAYAPPPQQHQPQLQRDTPPPPEPRLKAAESSGELTLELKPSTPCPGCGKEYYDEEMPEPDEKGKIRCRRCKKVMRDTNVEEDDGEEEEESDEKSSSKKGGGGEKKRLIERRRPGGASAGPAKKKPAKKPEPQGPETVILDDKFKNDVYNALKQGDEDKAKKRCLELVKGREQQAKQIYDHLYGVAKKKNWLGIAKLAATSGRAPAPKPQAPPPKPQAPPPPPPPQPGFAPPYQQPGPPQGYAYPPQGYAPPPPPGFAPQQGYAPQPGFAPPYQQQGFAPPPPQGFAPSFTQDPGIVAEPIPSGLELLPESDLGAVDVQKETERFQPPPPPPPPQPLEALPELDATEVGEPEPAEKGFLTRVALDGRLAQLDLLVGSRRFAAARDLAQGILAREPRAARAHSFFAEALAGLGDDEQALDAAQKGARLDPDDARTVRVYAQALARKGRLPEAVNALRRVVGPGKGEARDAVLLADIMRRQGDEAAARRIMDEVVSRDPQSLEPTRQAILARVNARDLDGGAEQLEALVAKEKPPRPIALACATELMRAIEAQIDRASPRAIVATARALDGCGKTIAAVRLLGPLVVRDPNSTDARRALGLAYARLGVAPLAEEHLRAVAGRGSAGADEFRALGELALERGDAEGATRVLIRARDLRPEDTAVRRSLARAYEASGELGKAVEELEAALARGPDREIEVYHESLAARAVTARVSALEARVREAPDDTQAHLDLGAALFEKGEADRAFDSLARAARDPYLIPRVIELVEYVHDELADPRPAAVLLKDLHLRAHDTPRAIEVSERFLKDHPEDDAFRLQLLELYAEGQRVAAAVEGLLALLPKAEKDRLAPAIALAQKILDREPMYHDLTRSVARAQRRAGDLEGAARSLERFIEVDPADREARLELAQALEDALEVEAAMKALRPLLDSGEPTADELSYAAALLARREKHDEAAPLLRKALARRPDDRSLKERLERCEQALRDREAARLEVELAAGRATEDDKKKLAGLFAEADKKEKALEILRALPGAPAGDGEAIFLRFAAEQFTRRGRIDKAEASLRQLCSVLAYAPGSEQEKAMLYRIGALYERGGDRRSARRVYLELVARDPNYRDAYSKLEAQEEAGSAAAENEPTAERRYAEFVEAEAPRDLKTIFEALGTLDLALDASLLAEAKAAASAVQTEDDSL